MQTYDQVISGSFTELKEQVAKGNFTRCQSIAKSMAEIASRFKDSDTFFSMRVLEDSFELLKVLEYPTADKKFVSSITDQCSILIGKIGQIFVTKYVDKNGLYLALRDFRWLVAETYPKRQEISQARSEGFIRIEDRGED